MPTGHSQPVGTRAVDKLSSLLPLEWMALEGIIYIFLKDPGVMEPLLPSNHLDNTPFIAVSSFPAPLSPLLYFCFLESSPK